MPDNKSLFQSAREWRVWVASWLRYGLTFKWWRASEREAEWMYESLCQAHHDWWEEREAAERYRFGLIRCAEIAGEDGEAIEAARSGALVRPSVEEWAVACVERLRKDYDDAE